MGDIIEETDSPIPGMCCVCGEVDDGDQGTVWEAIDSGGEIRDEDWYLHIYDVEDIENGTLKNPDVYLFCPDCSPDTPLPTAEEKPNFDMETFVEGWRDELDK